MKIRPLNYIYSRFNETLRLRHSRVVFDALTIITFLNFKARVLLQAINEQPYGKKSIYQNVMCLNNKFNMFISPSRRIIVSIRHVILVLLVLVGMGPFRYPEKPEAPLPPFVLGHLCNTLQQQQFKNRPQCSQARFSYTSIH